MSKQKQDPKKRAPIVLEDLLPTRDIKGGSGASVVFGVLSHEKKSNDQEQPKRRRRGHETP